MAQQKRKLPEFNAASMADIAFLLLIFFLLVTTIQTDKGIVRKLPPMPEGPPPEVNIRQRNVFIILVNSRDKLLVEGEFTDIGELKRKTKEFILNPYKRKDLAESPEEAVISLKADRGTSYDMYIQVQNELTAAYNEIRKEVSQRLYGVTFEELKKMGEEKKVDRIQDNYPMQISEAEPENVGG